MKFYFSIPKKWRFRGTVFLTLVSAIALWLSTIIWSPVVADFIAARYVECRAPTSEACKWVHERLGVTGDLFGAASSFFSGLGLFGVAVTLWIDTVARRSSRKPLVACELGEENPISLDNPSLEDPKSLRLTIKVTASNGGEAALNAEVNARLIAEGVLVELERRYIPVPLIATSTRHVEFRCVLHNPQLDPLLYALRVGTQVRLSFDLRCDSLEGMRWSTQVTYGLSCVQELDRRRLESVERRTDTFDSDWSGRAAVPLAYEVIPNSWVHTSV